MKWIVALWRKMFPRKKIVDHSRRRKHPDRLPYHWLYILLAGFAVVASLWQYGNAQLTTGILIALPLAGVLAYVPYRVIPSWSRFTLQLLIALFAGGWLFCRLGTGVVADKALLELLSVMLLIFCMAQNSRDYGYLFMIAAILLLYGALLPRTIYLFCLVGALVVTLVLLYNNRVRQLASSPNLANPRGIVRRNWHLALLHTLLTLGLFWLIFPHFPSQSLTSYGMFAVGFSNDKESLLPASMQKWFQSEKSHQNGEGSRIVRSGRPDTLGGSGTPISLKNAEEKASSSDGSGSSTPGRDLVLRVKSPLKLYHLAQLYDHYNGEVWITTDRFKRSGLRRDVPTVPSHQHLVSRYTIHKWITPKLPSPYRPLNFEREGDGSVYQQFRVTFFNAELLGDTYPALPFSYRAISVLDVASRQTGEVQQRVVQWPERLPRTHYLQLPEKRITERLRKKVEELTRNCPDDYSKAIALRDYLRNNYRYEQYSRAVPEGREAADYFVFDLKAGHCEYFASALAVMARIAGLPSRVASGFSPGDYNTLLNVFEVYEYHAHAWTQIHIDEYGWLTMDPTPPGEIQSRTTPIGLGQLRDPFGDEWRVTPPELTEHTLSTLQEAYLRELEREKEKAEPSILDELAKAEETIRNQVQEAYRKIAPPSGNEAKKIQRPLTWRQRLDQAALAMRELWHSGVEWVLSHQYQSGAAIAVLAALLWVMRHWLGYWRRGRLARRGRKMLHEAVSCFRDGEYRESVRAAYRAARLRFILEGMPRRKNRELSEYANEIAAQHPAFGIAAEVIFRAFYEAEYAPAEPTRETAARALRHALGLRRLPSCRRSKGKPRGGCVEK